MGLFAAARLAGHAVERVLVRHGCLIVVDGTAPDGQPELEEWTHQIEKLRDPSHGRFVRPEQWIALCDDAGLAACRCEVSRLKQPDLEWYFETADTPPSNRVQVRELLASASPSVREYFGIGEEDGKTVWWWPRLHLVARKVSC